jgi:hypothetical protein
MNADERRMNAEQVSAHRRASADIGVHRRHVFPALPEADHGLIPANIRKG